MRLYSPLLLVALPVLFWACSGTTSNYQRGLKREKSNPAKALQLFEQGCAQGEALACLKASRYYLTGNQVARDPFRAHELARKACSEGAHLGCVQLADFYLRATGTKRDVPKAFLLYQRACLAGESKGCTGLGLLHERGEGTKKDLKKARTYYERACKKGDSPQACLRLSVLLCTNSASRGCPRALVLLDRLCQNGDMRGCAIEGLLRFSRISKGAARKTQLDRVLALARKACSGGQGAACHLLHLAMRARSPGRSTREHLSRACTLGYQRGCVDLAHALYDGQGVKKDRARAISLYKGACKKKEPAGCTALGLIAAMDSGGSAEALKAAPPLFAKACLMDSSRGALVGCLHLGRSFAKGLGVERNVGKARTFYKKACDGGIKEACALLKELSAQAPSKP